MSTPQETAYPTLKNQISKETLQRVYSPSASEVALLGAFKQTTPKLAKNISLYEMMNPFIYWPATSF
jgi:hypothetical protein